MKAVIFLKILFVFLLLLLFYFSSYRMVGENVVFGVYGAYLTFVLLLTSLILFKVKRVEYNKTLIILVCLFTLTSIVSAFFNSEFGMVIQSLLFLLLFLSTTVVANSYFKDSIGKAVTLTLLIAHIPIIILPLVMNGIESFPYSGIFANPNSFGIAAVTLFATFVGILLSKIEKGLFYKEKPSKMSLLVYFLLAILSFVLVIFSASRSSFLAGIISVFAGLFLIFLFSIKRKRTLNLFFKSVLSLPILVGLYFIVIRFIPINQYIEDIILSKFDRKSGDLLDGRSDVWTRTVNEAGFFGNGEKYFDQVGLGAHNTFVYILGVYGWIPMIIFCLFFAVSLYYCIKFVLNSNHAYKYLPFIILITFFALSMTENQMYKITMVVAFVLIGLAANNKSVVITS